MRSCFFQFEKDPKIQNWGSVKIDLYPQPHDQVSADELLDARVAVRLVSLDELVETVEFCLSTPSESDNRYFQLHSNHTSVHDNGRRNSLST